MNFLNRIRNKGSQDGDEELERRNQDQSLDEDMDYIPESISAAFEEANRKLEEAQADFLAEDCPSPRNPHYSTFADDPFSPLTSPPPVNPAFGVTSPPTSMKKNMESRKDHHPRSSTLNPKPEETNDASMEQEDLSRIVQAASEAVTPIIEAQRDKDQNVKSRTSPLQRGDLFRSWMGGGNSTGKKTKRDPVQNPSPSNLSHGDVVKSDPPVQQKPLVDLLDIESNSEHLKPTTPISKDDDPFASLVPTSTQATPHILLVSQDPFKEPQKPPAVVENPSQGVATPLVVQKVAVPPTPLSSHSKTEPFNQPSRPTTPPPQTNGLVVSLSMEEAPAPLAAPSPHQEQSHLPSNRSFVGTSPAPMSSFPEAQTTAVLTSQVKTSVKRDSPPKPKDSPLSVSRSSQKNAFPTMSPVSSQSKQAVSQDSLPSKGTPRTFSTNVTAAATEGQKALVLPTPPPPPPPPSSASQPEHQSKRRPSPPKPISASSHLLQPTSASVAKFSPETKENSAEQDGRSSLISTNIAQVDEVHDHFLQPTSASKGKTPSPPTRTNVAVLNRPVNRDLVNRLSRPTSASKAKISPDKGETTRLAHPDPASSFQRPLNKSNVEAGNASHVTRPSTMCTSRNSVDRLLRPTRSSEAPVVEGRERARERVRERMAKARKAEVKAGTKALESPENKFSPDVAVEKAKERLRRRQKEELVTLAQSSQLFGQKLRSNTPPPPVTRKRTKLTVPHAPKFATDSRLGPRIVTSESKEQEESPTKKQEDGPRRLTIPKAPSFVTTKKLGEPHQFSKEKEHTLAQSTDILARGLRDSKPAPRNRRKLTPTVPQSPKFHVAVQRAKPLSTEERELEIIKEAQAKPFRARQIPASTRHVSSSAPRTAPRRPTVPKPFHLRSEGRALHHRPPEACPDHEVEGLEEIQHQFKARPMPNFAQPSFSNNARNQHPSSKSLTTTPKPFHLSAPRTSVVAKDINIREEERKFKARPIPSTTYTPLATRSISLGTQNIASGAERHRRGTREGDLSPPSNPRPYVLRSTLRQEAFMKKKEIEMERQEKKGTSFRARPHGATAPAQGGMKSPKTATGSAPRPFVLSSETRHDAFAAEQKRRLAQEERELRRQSVFKARPVPKSTYKAQKIQPKPAPLVDPFSPELQMKQRVQERKAFDEKAARDRHEDEVRKQEMEAAARAEEEAELMERRQLPVSEGGMIPTAQPIGY